MAPRDKGSVTPRRNKGKGQAPSPAEAQTPENMGFFLASLFNSPTPERKRNRHIFDATPRKKTREGEADLSTAALADSAQPLMLREPGRRVSGAELHSETAPAKIDGNVQDSSSNIKVSI